MNFLLWVLSFFFGYKLGTLDFEKNKTVSEHVDGNSSKELKEISEQVSKKAPMLLESITVKIPTDYKTLQEAVDKLSVYKVSQGASITLLIEKGYQPSAGLILKDGDYSYFTIASEDKEVLVSDNFTGTLMMASNAKMPLLNCLFNQRQLGYSGYWIESNSTGIINPGCGVINAGPKGNFEHRGLYVGRGSTLSGDGAVFTNAGGRGAWITRGATASLEKANFDNAGDVGVYVSRNSTVHIPYSSIKNAGTHAIWVHRTSRLNAQDGVNLSGAKGNALYVTRASNVSVNNGAIAEGIGGTGVEVINSVVVCNGLKISGKKGNKSNGIESNGGSVYADTSIVSSFGGNGIFAARAGVIGCEGSKIINIGRNGVAVARHGKVYIGSGQVTGSGNKDLVLYDGAGGEINAVGCKTTQSKDANPVIEDTNITTFNSISGNQGIIWA